jgi:hypothetical protein
MKKQKLKFCLVVDVEGFSMFDTFHPRWSILDKFKFKLNYLIRNLRYDKHGFQKIYRFLNNEKFPVSLMLVGNKFKPLSPVSSENIIDWGYHSLNHKRLTTLNNEELNKEIENKYNFKSFSAPMWMIKSDQNPERVFNVLKKQGYKIALYRGTDNEIISKKHYCKIKQLQKEDNLKLVHTSNTFDGGSKKEKIQLIKKQILNNLDKEVIYCLQTHDFSHKNIKNLREIVKFVKNLQKQNKLNIVNLSQL